MCVISDDMKDLLTYCFNFFSKEEILSLQCCIITKNVLLLSIFKTSYSQHNIWVYFKKNNCDSYYINFKTGFSSHNCLLIWLYNILSYIMKLEIKSPVYICSFYYSVLSNTMFRKSWMTSFFPRQWTIRFFMVKSQLINE